MKSLIRRYNNWRYRRLYRKLFFFYAEKHLSAVQAANEATEAFAWLCGFEYADLFKHHHKPDV